MPCITFFSNRSRRLIFGFIVSPILLIGTAHAEVFTHPSILGATSCSTSGCHGGAEEKSLQYSVWSQQDPHSRAFATLTTARSARMAEALGIADPTTSPSCVSCHAPMQAVKNTDPLLLAPDAKVSEGVSCASCHGASGSWVRSHTRTDFSHAEKVAAGLKDLQNLHGRANTCVACHQVIDPELVTKGRHPRLVFELDGHTASQPRHWREADGYSGAQAWRTGQAVALREMSWALAQGKGDGQEELRWRALLWVLRGVDGDGVWATVDAGGGKDAYKKAQGVAEQTAVETAAAFDASRAAGWLTALASTSGAFADKSVDRLEQAYRAERLVLALDRLSAGKKGGTSARLDRLFVGVQSIPDFKPDEFSKELAAYLKALGEENKL